jgi:hypothetical protein
MIYLKLLQTVRIVKFYETEFNFIGQEPKHMKYLSQPFEVT